MSSVDSLSQSIVVIGLNAALQKRFILPPSTNLKPGNVHRAYKCETGVGGKGQDVGVALSCLMTTTDKKEANDKVLLAQFLGKGPEGDQVSHILKTQHGLSDTLTIRNNSPLRTCTTIVGADEATELVETSGEVTPDEMKLLQDKIDTLTTKNGKANCICIMGSMPPGCKDTTYSDLTKRLASKDSLVLIDSVIGLDPLLGVLKSIFEGDTKGGAVLKLNAAELCKLGGVDKLSGETAQVTAEELVASTKGFIKTYEDSIGALDYLCITDGKFPGHVIEMPSTSSGDLKIIQLSAIDLSKDGTLYPIGAGDTVAASTLTAWQYLHHVSDGSDNDFFGVIPSNIGEQLSKKKSEWKENVMATAFAYGLSCGSASCLQEENSVFRVDDAGKYFEAMNRPVVQ